MSMVGMMMEASCHCDNLLPLLANADSEAVKAQAVAKVRSAVERQVNKVSIL